MRLKNPTAFLLIVVVAVGFAIWCFRAFEISRLLPAHVSPANSTSTLSNGKRFIVDHEANKVGTVDAHSPASSTHASHAASLRRVNLGSLTPSGSSISSPFAPEIGGLEDRAKNGDADAALKLWYGLQRCQHVMSDSELNYIKDKNVDPDLSSRIKAIDSNVLDACKDVTSQQIAGRYTWLKQAAANGNPQARYFYAGAGVDAVGGVQAALQNEDEWANYKDTSLEYMDDLAEQCSPDAISYFWYGYKNGTAMLGVDPVKAYFYMVIAQSLLPTPNTFTILERFQIGLTPEQIAQQSQAANAFVNAYCTN